MHVPYLSPQRRRQRQYSVRSKLKLLRMRLSDRGRLQSGVQW